MIPRVTCAAALALLAASSDGFGDSRAAAEPVRVERVHERVYLVRDKPGTQTHFQMVVNAGCSDEANGDCRGLAHYLEHLVLVGRNPEHRTSAIRFFPDAYANGWTNDRATVYVHTTPPRAEGPIADLEKLFAFYAARLRDFSIDDAEAERERRVVRQEHDLRVGSQPFRRFARDLNRELLPDHPSGQWTIGTADAIDAFTLADAKAYHRTWYHLNNVHFVVRGDVEPARLKEIADKALAGLAPQPLPPRALQVAPGLAEGRKDLRARDRHVKRPGVMVTKAVRIEEPDRARNQAARLLVANYLSGRLPGSAFAIITEQKKLAAGQVSVSIRRAAPRTFVIALGANVAPGGDPLTLREAMVAYLDGLGTTALDVATLGRLKGRFADGTALADQDAQRVYDRLIGWLADRNRFEELADWPARVAAVTPEDVAKLMSGFAGPGKLVTGILEPEVGP